MKCSFYIFEAFLELFVYIFPDIDSLKYLVLAMGRGKVKKSSTNATSDDAEDRVFTKKKPQGKIR